MGENDVPLKVIGAGFGRTGTLTLKTALEMLGFGPCHHMTAVIDDVDRQSALWTSVTSGARFDWDEVYAGYRSTVDWPGCHYWAELAERYPDAKVVLSVRDAERWYDSMQDTILSRPVGRVMMRFMRLIRHPMAFAQQIISRDTFGYDYSRANVIAAYERHNAAVRARVPAERLLVFDVREGWEPLCRFLDVPVPDQPFPRVNDRDEFKQHAAKVVKMRPGLFKRKATAPSSR
jgi:hypothetical protein